MVEFIAHQLIKVVSEHKVLKLGQLHAHDLLLDLVENIVRFTSLQIAFHVHPLLKLCGYQKDVFVMASLVSQELLLTELKQVCLMVEDPVFVLITDSNDLVVFLENQLRTLDLSFFVEVWEDEQLVKGLLPSELGNV